MLADALGRMEVEWQRLGVPVADVLRPGMDPGALVARLEETFGHTHASALSWFGWHDGSVGKGWVAAPLMLQLLPLDDAIEARRLQMTVNADDADEFDPRWNETWLPLTDAPGSAMYALDVVTGHLIYADWWWDDFSRVVADVLEEAVDYWVDVLRGGYYSWDGEDWIHDFASFPEELRRSRLVQ